VKYFGMTMMSKKSNKPMLKSEILEILIRMESTSEEFEKNSNYKGLIRQKLKNMGYKGKQNFEDEMEFLDGKGYKELEDEEMWKRIRKIGYIERMRQYKDIYDFSANNPFSGNRLWNQKQNYIDKHKD
jgi:hypothetical protein